MTNSLTNWGSWRLVCDLGRFSPYGRDRLVLVVVRSRLGDGLRATELLGLECAAQVVVDAEPGHERMLRACWSSALHLAAEGADIRPQLRRAFRALAIASHVLVVSALPTVGARARIAGLTRSLEIERTVRDLAGELGWRTGWLHYAVDAALTESALREISRAVNCRPYCLESSALQSLGGWHWVWTSFKLMPASDLTVRRGRYVDHVHIQGEALQVMTPRAGGRDQSGPAEQGLGYERGNILDSTPRSLKLSAEDRESLQGAMLAHAPSAHVLAFFLGHWAAGEQLLPHVPSLRQLHGYPCEADALRARAFLVSHQLTPVAHTTRLLHRMCSFRGGDLRNAASYSGHPLSLPRRSIDARRFRWRTVIAFPHRQAAHINIHEVAACLVALKWRVRSKREFNSRIVHCTDSQVVMSALAKGRSKSPKLNAIVRRLNSILLATHVHAVYAYVRTADNTADVPSRRRWVRQ